MPLTPVDENSPVSNPEEPMIRCYYCQSRNNYSQTHPLRTADNPAGADAIDLYRMCQSCFETSSVCCNCHLHFMSPGTRGVTFNGRLYCSYCISTVAFRCRDCGTWQAHPERDTDDFIRALDHGVCRECHHEYHTDCAHCGRYMYNDESHEMENEDGEEEYPVCRSCYEGHIPPVLLSNTFNNNPHERTVGFEIEFFAHDSDFEQIRRKLHKYGGFHADGSIRPEYGDGHEFASSPSNGDRLMDMIDTVCFTLQRNDADINASCGLHVHLDVRKMKESERDNILNWWCQFEPLFFAIVSPSRRSNEYSQSVLNVIRRENPIFNSAGQFLNPPSASSRWRDTRYTSLNICAFGEHGTFEVRLHQGTINAGKIKNWIRILLEFFSVFSQIEMTQERLNSVKAMSSRELMIFFFKQMSLPLKLRKYVMARYHEFNKKNSRHAPYILLDKRGSN